MNIIAFDIGIKNLAWAFLSFDSHSKDDDSKIKSFDLYNPFDSNIHQMYMNVHNYLKSLMNVWKDIDIILIEQQMSTKYIHNIKAIKISQHIYAFFIIHFPNKIIQEFKPSLKTSYFNVKFEKKIDRKKWAVSKTQQIYHLDPVFLDLLDCYPKKDDICDCILMCIVYYNIHFTKK
jgi:hypothetical protein